jgi:glutathione S-transferase
MELGYLDIKGVAEPLRWIWHHFKLDITEWNPVDEADWNEKAKTLGKFASLPYLKDGDLVISETTKIPAAIPYYLIEKAGKPNFLGSTPAEKAKVKMVESLLSNIRQKCFDIIDLPAGSDYKAEVHHLFNEEGTIYNQIKELSEMLADKDYIFGHLTFADFMLTFTARFTGAMCYSLLGYSPYARFNNIVALMHRVSNLPGIKERLEYATIKPYLPASSVPFKFLNFQEMIDLGMNPI